MSLLRNSPVPGWLESNSTHGKVVVGVGPTRDPRFSRPFRLGSDFGPSVIMPADHPRGRNSPASVSQKGMATDCHGPASTDRRLVVVKFELTVGAGPRDKGLWRWRPFWASRLLIREVRQEGVTPVLGSATRRRFSFLQLGSYLAASLIHDPRSERVLFVGSTSAGDVADGCSEFFEQDRDHKGDNLSPFHH